MTSSVYFAQRWRVCSLSACDREFVNLSLRTHCCCFPDVYSTRCVLRLYINRQATQNSLLNIHTMVTRLYQGLGKHYDDVSMTQRGTASKKGEYKYFVLQCIQKCIISYWGGKDGTPFRAYHAN